MYLHKRCYTYLLYHQYLIFFGFYYHKECIICYIKHNTYNGSEYKREHEYFDERVYPLMTQ